MAGVNGVAVGAVGAGVLLVWSGITGSGLLLTVQELIKGQQPSGTKIRPIDIPDAPDAPAGSGGGSKSGGGSRSGGGPAPTPGLNKLPPGGGGSTGGGGDVTTNLPQITPRAPQVAPAPVVSPPPGRVLRPTPEPPTKHYPWYDPRGWF